MDTAWLVKNSRKFRCCNARKIGGTFAPLNHHEDTKALRSTKNLLEDLGAQPVRHQRMMRRIPCLIRTTLKFRSSPSLTRANLRYVKTCASCTGRSLSTDFSSTITLLATSKSSRSPGSTTVPSYTIGIDTCFSNRISRLRSSIQRHVSYTDSSNPGSKAEWILYAASTTCLAAYSVSSGKGPMCIILEPKARALETSPYLLLVPLCLGVLVVNQPTLICPAVL